MEFIAQEVVESLGFATWCPSIEAKSRNKPVTRPLFSGYLFVSFHPRVDKWRPIYYCRGVKRLMMASVTEPAQIRTDVIVALAEAIERETSEALKPISRRMLPGSQPLEIGTTVKINKGSLAQFTGIVTWSDAQRIKVLYSIFGHQSEADLSINDVSAV